MQKETEPSITFDEMMNKVKNKIKEDTAKQVEGKRFTLTKTGGVLINDTSSPAPEVPLWDARKKFINNGVIFLVTIALIAILSVIIFLPLYSVLDQPADTLRSTVIFPIIFFLPVIITYLLLPGKLHNIQVISVFPDHLDITVDNNELTLSPADLQFTHIPGRYRSFDAIWDCKTRKYFILPRREELVEYLSFRLPNRWQFAAYFFLFIGLDILLVMYLSSKFL